MSGKNLLIALITFLALTTLHAQEKKALELSDLMKFRQIQSPVISDDGKWVAHAAVPDRGDPEVMVYSTGGEKKLSIPLGKNPVISGNGRWVAVVQAVPADKLLKAKPDQAKKLKSGLVLLNTSTGEQSVYESIKSFSFSNDSQWLICHS